MAAVETMPQEEKVTETVETVEQEDAKPEVKHKCKKGHALTEFVTKKGGYSCDVCSRQNIPRGTSIYRCKGCDYDKCDKCCGIAKEEPKRAPRKKAGSGREAALAKLAEQKAEQQKTESAEAEKAKKSEEEQQAAKAATEAEAAKLAETAETAEAPKAAKKMTARDAARLQLKQTRYALQGELVAKLASRIARSQLEALCKLLTAEECAALTPGAREVDAVETAVKSAMRERAMEPSGPEPEVAEAAPEGKAVEEPAPTEPAPVPAGGYAPAEAADNKKKGKKKK